MPEENETLKVTNTDFPRRKKKDAENKDFFTRIISVQIIVVAMLIGGVFALKKANPENFELLKASYTYIMKNDMSVREVFASIKNIVISPQGGDDISVFSPQSGTTFSPYYISSEICIPVNGRITSPFGYRINPFTKAFSFHSGLDIAAPHGDKIKAAYYGKVTKVSYDSVGGNFVELAHNDGLVTQYFHCSEVVVKEGMVVRSGETIALVGSTGRSTGPHLHFVIKVDGKNVNPLYVMDINDNTV